MLPCSNVPQFHSIHWTIIFNVRAASVHVINMDSWTRLGPVRVYEAGLRIYKVKCSCVVGFVLIQIIFFAIFNKNYLGRMKGVGDERGVYIIPPSLLTNSSHLPPCEIFFSP